MLVAVANSSSWRSPAQRWSVGWLVPVLTVVFLIASASLTYFTFRQSRENVVRLSDIELPLLQETQALDLMLLRVQSDIYAYYLTADDRQFDRDFRKNNRALDAHFSTLARDASQAPMLGDIKHGLQRLQALGAEFDSVMRAESVDWDRARSVLDQLEPLTTDLNLHSRSLSQWTADRITTASQKSLSQLSLTLTLLSAALLAALMAGFTLLWINKTRLAAIQRLHYLAFHDPDTGLRNRQEFYADAAALFSVNAASHHCVALIKIDGLQDIVERGGMGLGDAVINDVATSLEAALTCEDRATNALYRIDSNLFAILFDTRGRSVAVVVEDLRSNFSRLFSAGSGMNRVTLSIGLAPLVFDRLHPEEVGPVDLALIDADVALRRVQRAGGDGLVLFDEGLANRAHRDRALKLALVNAISEGQMSLRYQPQIDARTGQILGAEALIRWNHPEMGWVSPAEFIEIAEQDQTILALGDWVITEVCRAAQQLGDVPSRPRLALNVSTRQLEQGTLVETVRQNLARFRLDPQVLELEITESATLQPTPVIERTLAGLKTLGVDLAIDDFGTGYSSLSYLHRLSLHRLKIDRVFVSGIHTDPKKQATVRAIIALASAHGLETVAEGIEEPAERDKVTALGADILQGFLLGKPLTLEDFSALLRQPSSSPGSAETYFSVSDAL